MLGQPGLATVQIISDAEPHSFHLSSPFLPQRCELCLKPGATVGCCLSSCLSNFHFMCARASYCIFQDDKKVFCQKHTDLLDGKVGQDAGISCLFPYWLVFPCDPIGQALECRVPAFRAFPSNFSTLCQFSNPHLLSASQEIVTPDGFDVLRRVYVDFEGINFKRKFLTGLEPDVINILIGKPFALLRTAADLTWHYPI